jgi:hypothetical protein
MLRPLTFITIHNLRVHRGQITNSLPSKSALSSRLEDKPHNMHIHLSNTVTTLTTVTTLWWGQRLNFNMHYKSQTYSAFGYEWTGVVQL